MTEQEPTAVPTSVAHDNPPTPTCLGEVRDVELGDVTELTEGVGRSSSEAKRQPYN